MRRPAFIAWLSKPGWFNREERERFASHAADLGMDVSPLGLGVLVASDRMAVGQRAALVGTLCRRPDRKALPAESLPTLLDSNDLATRLIDDHWGDYIAIGALGPDRPRAALRAPFGDLACYWQEADEHLALASSVALLSRFDMPPPSIDWQSLGRFLAATDLRTGATCLAEIGELNGGQSVSVSQRGTAFERHWSPWDWTLDEKQFATREDAADAMGMAIDASVSARVQKHDRSVLLLSGGLDSSVIAAALTGCERSFTVLTMVVGDRQGDEREHARAVAERLHVPLVERIREADMVDLSRPLAARLPRPVGSQFRQATFRAADAVASDLGAAAILDGGGGDNMFCSLRSVAPLVDELFHAGPTATLFRTAQSIARMTNVGVAEVAQQALARIVTRRRRYRWAIDRSLLDSQAYEGFVPQHPWLDPPPGTPPGKAAQVALILAATAVTESPDGERDPPILSPLVSQRIAEAALRVPSWMWFEHGHNRAIVRRAYADRLPGSIVQRRSKGTPTGFLSLLVEANADMLRPFLLDGLLATNRVLDLPAVEALLAGGPARDLGFARLLQLADAEAWARSWA